MSKYVCQWCKRLKILKGFETIAMCTKYNVELNISKNSYHPGLIFKCSQCRTKLKEPTK